MGRSVYGYVLDRRVHTGRRWLQAGLAAARLLEDRAGESLLLAGIGRWHHQRGRSAVAIEYLESSAHIAEKRGDLEELAATLNVIGMVYRAIGKPDKARKFYERSLLIIEEVGDRAGLAQTLNNIGVAHSAEGEPEIALSYYKRALPIWEEAGDQAQIATTLNNIGVAHSAKGEPRIALSYYKQALPIRKEVGDQAGLALTLNNIGDAHNKMGEPEEALEYLKLALPIVRQIGAVQSIATQLSNLAILLHKHPELGQTGDDIRYLEEATAILEESRLHHTGGGLSLETMQQRLAQWRRDTSNEPDIFEALTNNTVGVMTGYINKREEWWNWVLKIQSRAKERGDSMMLRLAEAIGKLLMGDDIATLTPELDGPYAACWERIVAGLKEEE